MDRTLEVEKRKIKIMVTLGNVMQQAGDDHRRAGSVNEATRHHEEALEIFEQAGNKDKWALFGKAEALYSLERFDESYPIYHGPLRSYAISEYLGRIEPRTKVLGRTMELICCVRVPGLHSNVTEAYRNAIEALSQVDERLTVYSQLQRRNIRQVEFRHELEGLVNSVEPGPPIG